jgi:predicted enzyme related to lactoylglutathione lyase
VAVLTGISPVLLVADLDRAVSFYRDQLGFECETYGEPANFATASRDQATLLIAVTSSPGLNPPHWQVVPAMWNAYIRVDDVEEMYREVQERGATIDYSIYDAPHGFREFGVQDPDGHDIAFGQPLNP